MSYAVQTRYTRIDMTRKAIRACSAKWYGDYCKAHRFGDRLLADLTDDELSAIYTAALLVPAD
jgi:hypothetical protein